MFVEHLAIVIKVARVRCSRGEEQTYESYKGILLVLVEE